MTTPIMQFGTSRFLQAHADLFISEALERNQAVGSITVVQSSGNAKRAERLKALSAPHGFPVRIQGLQAGEEINNTVQVTSVHRSLSTATSWDAIVEIFVDEVDIVLSNTADSGYAHSAADEEPTFNQAMSYPAKLTQLLLMRFKRNPKPIQIIPMELIVDNGQILKKRVLELAQQTSPAFLAYLSNDVTWVNSLVDRIVSEPLEPAGAVAEPYALWAIEDQSGLILPCRHDCIKVVGSLAEIEAMKLFVLNLGHTYLAQKWIEAGRLDGATVVAAISDDETKRALCNLYNGEVRPAFVAAGLENQIDPYIETTLERFANPFLHHQLSDIAQNHSQKIERRISAFLDWAKEKGDTDEKPVLAAMVKGVNN
ncbi:MAG: mannitol dehydrogenase family protein [Stappiaceae bacterium]